MSAPGTGMIADDYFAGGGGGWDVAAELLGIHVVGYEIMDEARRTRSAAGLKTSEIIDVREITTTPGAVDLQLASPPCQSFSMAGKGAGRRALDAVLEIVATYRDGQPMPHGQACALMGDERTALVVEPLRLALEGRPMFIAWEQVPTVLPVWEACADVLRHNGYSVATGCLNSEQYGVPQTRKRAILIARRDGGEAHMPAPTHSLYYGRTPAKLDPGVHKWVSMAEALGWEEGAAVVGFPRLADTTDTTEIDGIAYRARDLRSIDEPAFALTEKARSWQIIFRNNTSAKAAERALDQPAPTPYFGQRLNGAGWHLRMSTMPNAAERPLDMPAPTIAFGHDANSARWHLRPAPTLTGEAHRWPWVRPATTVMGDPRLGAPGHRDREGGERHHEKSIRITIEQAAVLQSFPADFPWQGSRTKQFLQIGNAIPPLLAYRILMTFFDHGPVISNTKAMAEWLEKPEQLSLFGDNL